MMYLRVTGRFLRYTYRFLQYTDRFLHYTDRFFYFIGGVCACVWGGGGGRCLFCAFSYVCFLFWLRHCNRYATVVFSVVFLCCADVKGSHHRSYVNTAGGFRWRFGMWQLFAHWVQNFLTQCLRHTPRHRHCPDFRRSLLIDVGAQLSSTVTTAKSGTLHTTYSFIWVRCLWHTVRSVSHMFMEDWHVCDYSVLVLDLYDFRVKILFHRIWQFCM